MLTAIKSAFGLSPAEEAALPALLMPGEDHDAQWFDLFVAGTREAAGVRDRRTPQLVEADLDEWLLKAPCVLLENAKARAGFVEWIRQREVANKATAELDYLAKCVRPLADVGEDLVKMLEEDRPALVRMLLSQLPLQKLRNGARELPAYTLANELKHEKIEGLREPSALALALILALQPEDVRKAFEGEDARGWLFNAGSAEDVRPEMDTAERDVRAAKANEALARAQARLAELSDAPGRKREGGRDLWIGCYYGLRHFNARALGPVDHLGRKLNDAARYTSAFKELGLVVGIAQGQLYDPSDSSYGPWTRQVGTRWNY